MKKYGGVPPYKETQAYVAALSPSFRDSSPAGIAPPAAAAAPGGGLPAGAAPPAQAFGSLDGRALMQLLGAQRGRVLAGQGPAPDYLQRLSALAGQAMVAPPLARSGGAAQAAGAQVDAHAGHDHGAPMPAAGGRVNLSAGGGWGGTEGPLKALTGQLPKGFVVSSEKRDRRNTASGGVSDHWTGSRTAFARDIAWGSSQPTPQADALASRIVAALGGPAGWGRRGGNFKAVVNGIRWQVIYRSNVGGNHYNHIHVGARRA